MTKPWRRLKYALWIGLLLLASALLGTQPLATAWDLPALFVLRPVLGSRAHTDLIFLGIVQGLLLAAAVLLYVRSQDRYRRRMPTALVFLNWLAPSVFASLAVAAWEYGTQGMIGPITFMGAPLALLGPPIIVLILERLYGLATLRAARWAEEQDWRRPALLLYAMAMYRCPGDPDILLRRGMIFAREEEFARAIADIERARPIDDIDDLELLRELERCYRETDNPAGALACLRRELALRPDDQHLTRKVIEELERQEHYEQALELMENSRLRHDSGTLLLRQRLNVRTGNYAQALEQIARIAERERPPYDMATRLYRDLIERLPHMLDVRIALGRLLLQEVAEDRRREGVEILEQALDRDPHRLYLARELIDYYEQDGQDEKLRPLLVQLVDAGDPHPESYLEYARLLEREGNRDEAIRVIRRMLGIAPDDLRGHVRLGHLLCDAGQAEQARTELARAAALADESDEQAIEHLRRDIERREREWAADLLARRLKEDPTDNDTRLELIEQLIDLDRPDHAVAQCSEALERDPGRADDVERILARAIEAGHDHFQVRDFLGDMFYRQGRYDDLLELYREMSRRSLDPDRVFWQGCRKILTRRPDHVPTRRELAQANRRMKNWEAVLEVLDPVMQGDHPDLTAHDRMLWADAAARLGRVADAIAVAEPLIDELVGEPDYALRLIEFYNEIEDYDRALMVHTRAMAASPQEPRLESVAEEVAENYRNQRMAHLRGQARKGGLTPAEHFEMAELHSEVAEIEQAMVHYQRAAEDPAHAGIASSKMALRLVERGMLDLAHEMLEPIELTREMVERQPEIKHHVYRVARALEKARMMKEATTYYKRLFKVDAGYADVVDRLAYLS